MHLGKYEVNTRKNKTSLVESKINHRNQEEIIQIVWGLTKELHISDSVVTKKQREITLGN